MITPEEIAERMKSEIVDDVKAGIVPASVATFAELNNYVDANCYGGSEKLLDELDAEAPDTDEGHTEALTRLCDLMNPAMEMINFWLKAGGIAKALSATKQVPGPVKVTVYRPKEMIGLGAPKAFLGEEHPTKGDWVQSAKAELPDGNQPPRLLLLGRAFLIYSMYHVREPRFMGYAVENFGAACKKLGYDLPLTELDAPWLTYGPESFDRGEPAEYEFMLGHIAIVFGTKAAADQAEALGIDWPPRAEHDPTRRTRP